MTQTPAINHNLTKIFRNFYMKNYLDHSMKERQDINQGPESWMPTALQCLVTQLVVSAS